MKQLKIPAVFMRGGTSNAVVFNAKDLPRDRSQWDAIFLAAIGSPDPYGRQLDGLAVLDAVDHGLARAALERPDIEDGRAVAVEHVLQRALFVAGACEHLQRVAFVYGAVLGGAALGRPAAARKSRLQRRVERAAVNAGLSAGHDLG